MNQPLYARMFADALKQEWPGGQVSVCRTSPSLGATFLAARANHALHRAAMAWDWRA